MSFRVLKKCSQNSNFCNNNFKMLNVIEPEVALDIWYGSLSESEIHREVGWLSCHV